MKLIGLFLTIASLVALAGPSYAQESTLPDSGTYFIVNSASGQALQPVGPTPGQSVLLYEFNKGGSQQWAITRKVDPVTKKPTNRYTIRLAGENTGLAFQPHPVADRTAMISSGTSTFVLAPAQAGLIIKSVDRNGDALFVFPDPPGNSQVHFGPSDGSGKFCWSFVAAE